MVKAVHRGLLPSAARMQSTVPALATSIAVEYQYLASAFSSSSLVREELVGGPSVLKVAERYHPLLFSVPISVEI